MGAFTTSASRKGSRAFISAAPAAVAVQRKCACGGTCDDCQRKQLQRRAASLTMGAVAPPIVHQVLSSPGRPLDPGTRHAMESRFGHDFGRVRVHADARATESVRAVDALAYTVERNVVFDNNYSPGTSEGRELLAHELAHVVQQEGSSRYDGSQPLRIGRSDDPLEAEADRIAAGAMHVSEGTRLRRARIQRRTPAITGLDESGPKADLTGKTEDDYYNCLKNRPPDPTECDPDRKLTWGDFSGTPSGSFSALTSTEINDVAYTTRESICGNLFLGKPLETKKLFQAKLLSAKSWVKQQFGDPTNRATSGCGANVTACEKFFDDEAKAGRSGGTFNLTPPPATCPASIAPDPSKIATSRDECESVLGAECDSTAQLESERLLRHEQLHFDIACVLAQKANAAREAGGDSATILTSARAKIQPLYDRYDRETQHGCIAASQASWENDVGSGLPNETVP